MLSLDQIISAIASIGTMLAAVATFLTVSQMAKQRRDSYRHELIVTTTPLSYRRCKWSKSEDDSREHPPSDYIDMFNVGLGAAKDVSIKLDFDIDRAVASVNALKAKTEFDEDITLNGGILDVSGTMHFWVNQTKIGFEYVLPVELERKPYRIRVPSSYLAIIERVMNRLFPVEKGIKGVDFSIIPFLMINMEFHDIAGDLYRRQYRIEFNFAEWAASDFAIRLIPKVVT